MTFSFPLAAFVWITLIAFFITSLVVVMSPTRRLAVGRLFARPSYQILGTLLAAGIGITMLSAVPVERNQQTDTLLQVTIEAIGAGLPEKAASAPFAVTDVNGEALEHVATRMNPESTPMRHLAKYSLVAIIAGGVTSVTAIIFTGMLLGFLNKISYAEGIRRLENFYWRPAMLTGTVLWMTLTWLLLIWSDWHVLGTTLEGFDRLAYWVGLSPWLGCIGFWVLIVAIFRAK